MTTGTRDGKGKALVTEESPAGLGVWRRSVRERRDDGVQRKRKGEGVARPSAAAPPCLKTWGLDLQGTLGNHFRSHRRKQRAVPRGSQARSRPCIRTCGAKESQITGGTTSVGLRWELLPRPRVHGARASLAVLRIAFRKVTTSGHSGAQ